ncbi:hypothetical protein NDU88_002045 [Pleurodeles waltl]|uniref:Uncharacterized protein n=1 Tax=Pleurodeles waltl TaxID=8319 RepID=A0AAV7Q7U2_PLEWA|nr:hypothetical protein NDU88_002045 [Pleurodeles waltl]
MQALGDVISEIGGVGLAGLVCPQGTLSNPDKYLVGGARLSAVVDTSGGQEILIEKKQPLPYLPENLFMA